MYFHTDNDCVLASLANAVTSAMADGRSLRIDVDGDGRLRYKVGEGMWTAPFESTPDPYRDASGS